MHPGYKPPECRLGRRPSCSSQRHKSRAFTVPVLVVRGYRVIDRRRPNISLLQFLDHPSRRLLLPCLRFFRQPIARPQQLPGPPQTHSAHPLSAHLPLTCSPPSRQPTFYPQETHRPQDRCASKIYTYEIALAQIRSPHYRLIEGVINSSFSIDCRDAPTDRYFPIDLPPHRAIKETRHRHRALRLHTDSLSQRLDDPPQSLVDS
jgi:hypothetical protein